MSEPRPILGPGGNRLRGSEESKGKKGDSKKPLRFIKKPVLEIQGQIVLNNVSTDSLCSSDSSSSGLSVKKTVNSRRRAKRSDGLSVKVVVPAEVVVSDNCSTVVKRCDWITPNSDQLYTTFHDEEWGVPITDDKKLFEILVLSQALGELSWVQILNKRDIFRKLFDHFDPLSIAKFTDQKLVSLKMLLSETKLRAVVENAKRVLQIQKEFGSFSNYCWKFVNHKPLRNGFRYARNVPAKTPKAELISKDLMKRGFRCAGPTVIYSFMQAAGLVNDHLITCFRYQQCNDIYGGNREVLLIEEAMENSSLTEK